MTKPTPPVPPDELIAEWEDEYGRLPYSASFPCGTASKYVARQAAAWGRDQAIPEREELAGLLMEADSVIECHVDHHDPDYAVRQLLRAAAERLRGGGSDG